MHTRLARESDLETFYAHQVGLSFYRPRAEFIAKMRANLDDERVVVLAIEDGERLCGYVAKFLREATPEVAYVIGADDRGKGLATFGLRELLEHVAERPLYARTAKDNAASIAVLQKNGFRLLREEQWRRTEDGPLLDDFVWICDAPAP